ncbi:hypothetical protein FHX46_005630 [Amycolatopsis viridis]|uniref:Uncharacterized protein n=1 Tax=Amycolatopsis viridis TaxID=185678 RepID=A0ABX0T2N2_9PSEU|nr:hypothetical protein [Amycolatopsis viridis]NIH83100.1 hypothetical protein [Amycolatopsis viridis]
MTGGGHPHIREKLTAQLADLDRWEAISLDTRFA